MRATRAAVALLTSALASSGLLLLPVPAQAVGDDVVLPVRPQRHGVGIVSGASPHYLLRLRHYQDASVSYGAQVVRISDGAVTADALPVPADASKVFLSGDDLVEVTTRVVQDRSAVTLRLTSADTGASDGTLDLAPDEGLVSARPTWAVTSTYVRNTNGLDEVALRIRHKDGTAVDLPGRYGTSSVTDVPGDDRHAFVRTPGNEVWDVDGAAGTISRVPTPLSYERVVVGPTRVFFRGNDTGGQVRLSWVDREGGATGQVDLATADVGDDPTLLPYGDSVAFTREIPNQRDLVLRPVSLADGSLGAQVASPLYSVTPTGDGRLALGLDGDPAGRFAVADAATGVRVVAALSPAPVGYGGLRLDGDTARVTAAGDASERTASDGTDGWTPDESPATSAGTTSLAALLTPDGYPSGSWRLRWPDGSRDVTAYGTSTPTLGHGGVLVGLTVPVSGGSAYQVQLVTTGEVVSTTPVQVGLEGTRVWTWDATGHAFVGTDVDTGDVRRAAGTGANPACGVRVRDVRGRFLMYDCGGDLTTVVDLEGVLPVFTVWRDVHVRTSTLLGNGFVAWAEFVGDFYEGGVLHLKVADLGAGRENRDLGALQHDWPGGSTFAVDEAGTPRVALVAADQRAHVQRLSWLTEAPQAEPDVLAPEVIASSSPNTLQAADTPVASTFSWTYRDRGPRWGTTAGLASYDVRTRPWTPGQGAGTWTTETGLPSARVNRTLTAGQGLCVAARARDADGNTSDWTADACTYADGTGPALGATSLPTLWAPSLGGSVTYGWAGSDDAGSPAYVAEYQVARASGRLGAWTTLSGPTSALSSTMRVGSGEEWCLRVRALDAVGHVSATSAASCTTGALDDRSFTVRHGVRRTSSRAIGRTYSELRAKGATAVSSAAQSGRTLGVWALAGPGQGSADVLVGSRVVGRVSLASTTTRAVLRTLPMPVGGRVTLRSRSSKPVRLDAISVVR